jgi:hypothetical protein
MLYCVGGETLLSNVWREGGDPRDEQLSRSVGVSIGERTSTSAQSMCWAAIVMGPVVRGRVSAANQR